MGSDKLNQLFHESNDQLPPEYEWSEMADGIYDKMEKRKKDKRILFPYFIGVGSLLIGLLAFGLLHYNQDAPTTDEINNNPTINQHPSSNTNKSNHSKKEVNEKTTFKNTGKQKSSTRDMTMKADPSLNKGHFSTQTEKHSPTKTQHSPQNSNVKYDHSNLSQIPTNTKSLFSNSTTTTDGSGDNKATTRPIVLHNRTSSSTSFESAPYLSGLPLLPLHSERVNDIALTPVFEPAPAAKPEETNTNKPSLRLTAGTYFIIRGGSFSGDAEYISVRNDATEVLPGWRQDLGIQLPLKKSKFALEVGSYYEEQYEEIDVVVDHEVENEYQNLLISQTRSALTNRVLRTVHADTTISSETQRHVRHLNKSQLIGLRIGVSRPFALGNKLQLNTGLHALVGYQFHTEGKTIDENYDIVQLEDYEMTNDWRFALQLNAELEYQFSSNWSIGAGIIIGQNINQLAKEESVSYRPHYFGFGGGVQYRF